MVDYGCYFTIGVEVLRAETIQDIARKLPVERLLTETDNPGGLKWLNGTTGMPAAIEIVVAKLAELRQTTVSSMIETVQANFFRLIQDDPWLLKSWNAALKLATDSTPD
jgi:TatD DNase family protein